jgi:3-isopropylmalate/(R)-2-methylmalate dehydratase large subunit
MGTTMFDKIWNQHVIAEEDGEILLHVDRTFIHEGSSHAFAQLAKRNRQVARPQQVFAHTDHYVPTGSHAGGVQAIAVPEIRNMVLNLHTNAERHGINLFGFDDSRQGILHIVPPEQGITQPGLLILGADSHTSTHGAFGSIAFGAGASEIMYVLATQRTWQRRPRTMRISVEGELGFGVAAKDVILYIISQISSQGGVGYVLEYAGSVFRAMNMDQRMTVCNMSIEAGARAGMIAPDESTYAYMDGRPWAPQGTLWDEALELWKTLPSDADAVFDRDVPLAAKDIAPMVSWGTNPEQTLPVTGAVPDPRKMADRDKRTEYESALDYMGLAAGMPLTDIKVDRVFIGSCTNGRLEDIRAAASRLDRILTAAGFEWREPGCSLCTAINGDQLQPGERCASTSNRNFRGRQGTGGRTHLVSPAMAAAAAIKGRFVDVREMTR